MRTPFVPSKVSWVKRCCCFGGFQNISGRHGNAYLCCWLLWKCVPELFLACCTWARKANQRLFVKWESTNTGWHIMCKNFLHIYKVWSWNIIWDMGMDHSVPKVCFEGPRLAFTVMLWMYKWFTVMLWMYKSLNRLGMGLNWSTIGAWANQLMDFCCCPVLVGRLGGLLMVVVSVLKVILLDIWVCSVVIFSWLSCDIVCVWDAVGGLKVCCY